MTGVQTCALPISVALTIGIVGLPNVGKSTLFNALTRATVLAANYPFATIEPNVGVVPLPDARLEKLASILLARRRPERPGGRLVERAWRHLALAQVLWYTALGIGWGLTRTLLNPAGAGGATTTAPLTSLFAPVVLLAVGSLPVRWAFVWVLLLGPLQILLNATPGAPPDYRVWLTAGYYTCLVLSEIGRAHV